MDERKRKRKKIAEGKYEKENSTKTESLRRK